MKLLKLCGKRKVLALSLCGVLCAGALVGAFALWGKREPESRVVSAGLQHVADGALVAASAVSGQPVTFTAEWFDGALRGGTVERVTVTALPPVTEGVLKLGYGEVSLGQCIPRETLSYLSFTPNDGVKKSSFSFVPETKDGAAGYALTCQMSLTDTVNCCPTGTKSATAVSTHETLALSGVLTAKDPEGDALCFEICDYPENGSVLLDSATGAFTYMPNNGYCGEDRFTWRVQDENGAFAPEAVVHVTVRELKTEYVFTDMVENGNHTHALRVSEAGLLGGEQIGGKHYFHPERALTRAAFVTVLLRAAEVKVPDAESTGYADDAEIPAPMKGAIKYAKEKGWLGEGESFRPNDAITRAEAAEIAAKVLSLSAPQYRETVEDFDAIPVSLADALYAIFEGGYISTMSDGTLAPMGVLTRGDAARFFAKILDGKEAH
ncbi:MAG: S-layer homology domain-containing protein [Clostridia bacterium]|nr:S-layer homology domain-containing protein [Clostridia bacterium]